MNIVYVISCLVALVVFLILTIVFGSIHYKRAFEKSFKPLSYFPYEMLMGRSDPFLILSRACGGLYLLSHVLCLGLLLQSTIPSALGVAYAIAIGVLGLAEVALLFFLFLFPASYPRGHITLVVFYFCGAILYGATSGLLLLLSRGESAWGLAFAIILFALALSVMVIALNPRFSYWAKLHVEQDKEGGPVIFRPKLFILAASEWAVVLLHALMSIALVVGLLLISL